MVFFAIFWGATFNAQVRWKSFQFPLFGIFKKVTRRVILSFVILNVLPVLYFSSVLWITSDYHIRIPIQDAIFLGVVPAFGIFGFYRLWLGIIELSPESYYYSINVPGTRYKNVEPLLGNWYDENKKSDKVYFCDKKTGMLNTLWAVIYISFGLLIPLIYLKLMI